MDDLEKTVMEGFAHYSTAHNLEDNNITQKHLDQCNKKAYLSALEGFLKTSYQREMVRNFCQEGTLPYTPTDLTLLKLLENQANAVSTKPPFILLTINPRPDIDLETLKKYIGKFIRKKSITTYFYVYEVRTESTGLHCHILLGYEAKPYDFKRSAKSTFKHVCDSSNPACLNFKFIEENTLQLKVNYLLGQKKDSKKQGVTYSEKYRIDNKLEPFYESKPPLPCRLTQTPLQIELVPENSE